MQSPRTVIIAYPEETIAITKQGRREVRVLIDNDEYLRYAYMDENNKISKKTSLLLNSGSKKEHPSIVPMAAGKSLVINQKSEDMPIAVWDNKTKKAIRF